MSEGMGRGRGMGRKGGQRHLQVAGDFGDEGSEAYQVPRVVEDDVGADLVLVDVHISIVVHLSGPGQSSGLGTGGKVGTYEDVGSPDAVGGYVEDADAGVVLRVPAEELVIPIELRPAVYRQDLVDFILQPSFAIIDGQSSKSTS